MNVDIFESDPNVKYYFASAVPMMIVVLVGWYFIKHFLARRRQTVRQYSKLRLRDRHYFSSPCCWRSTPILQPVHSLDIFYYSTFGLQMGILTLQCASLTNGESTNTFSSNWRLRILDCGLDLVPMIV